MEFGSTGCTLVVMNSSLRGNLFRAGGSFLYAVFFGVAVTSHSEPV